MTANLATNKPLQAEACRPRQQGKFFFTEQKLYIRGVTYGTFHPDENGDAYPPAARVDQDFALMPAHGINAVRTYTAPPRWLLDLAHRHGLVVMIGLPWEQHITFLDDPQRRRSIIDRVRNGVRACAGHPAVFAYAIGNEIPASIVRWYGSRRIERFLKQLYDVAKSQDPDGLVTYVNYPTTEYLQLPFLDFCCFNVYLEAQQSLDAYLAHLQVLAGDRPLLMAEVGLDSRRNGMQRQADVLDWQIRSTFGAGCAGMFVFSWTDEWHRGGSEIEDWDFGLTTRDRSPKPALATVREAFADVPFSRSDRWPRISVVLCSYNGSATINETLAHLQRLDYPNYEVITVNDGSTDATEAIMRRYPFRPISVKNGGLSRARNLGMEAATGEIIAYIDDDAYPDPDWLVYLAHTFKTTTHAGVGGPNLQPPGDGPIAECVANAPGGPIHVLLSDREAEHIPGCNMAFRKPCLQAIGGFDPQFRVAGDDVDVCWRLQEKGWTLGFSPAAMVWHHRRGSVRTFWRQQAGYGKAEALLERKWPEKYNSLGHATWSGRVYNSLSSGILHLSRPRIYHGRWGLAPFQRLYPPPSSTWGRLHELPEWYLIILLLAILSALGLTWRPLLLFAAVLLPAVSIPLVQTFACTRQMHYASEPRSRGLRWAMRALTMFLCLMQPVARLWGRIKHGLTPWRSCIKTHRHYSLRHRAEMWLESWRSPEEWLQSLESAIRRQGIAVVRGGDLDSWDLRVRGGLFCCLTVCLAVEEHAGGKQLARFRGSPWVSPVGTAAALACAATSTWAIAEHHWTPGIFLGVCAVILVGWMIREWGYAGKSLQVAFEALRSSPQGPAGSSSGPGPVQENASVHIDGGKE